MLPIITPAEAAAWETTAEHQGRSLRMLMESAGRAVASVLLCHHGADARRGVLIATGRGNNGGDGWVAARLLHRLGYPVAVASLGEPNRIQAVDARRIALLDGVREVPAADGWPAVGVAIDAILGGGRQGPLRDGVRAVCDRLRDLAVPLIAIDAPTGLDLTTGVSTGARPVTRTVTFGGLRRGQLRARDLVGDLHVVEIGLPTADSGWPRLFDLDALRAGLGLFGAAAHKGTRGRVVIVGGALGMTGAGRLAARGAFASGAGLVHVATDEASATALETAEPDVQVHRTSLTGAPDAALLDLVRRADAVVIGPGLGRGDGQTKLVEGLLEAAVRVVLDADGLQAFAGRSEQLAQLLRGTQAILTPHPGEFHSLFPDITLDDPWDAAAAAATRLGQTVLLKGVPTVIGTPEAPSLTTARGNPGLATGGSGDILSGIIAGLWCRHDQPQQVAALAAVALGRAAELAAGDFGVAGMRPMNVIDALGEVWQECAAPDQDVAEELLHLPRPAAR